MSLQNTSHKSQPLNPRFDRGYAKMQVHTLKLIR